MSSKHSSRIIKSKRNQQKKKNKKNYNKNMSNKKLQTLGQIKTSKEDKLSVL